MNAATKLAVMFPGEGLQQDLDSIPAQLWTPVLKDRVASPWSGVALRSHDGSPTTLDCGAQYFDTPLCASLDHFRRVMNYFKCDLLRVRLLALQPGGVVRKHTDLALDSDTPEARLHLPVQTNERAIFQLGGASLLMVPGELWFLDVSVPHSVTNQGREPRVHLVIDCRINRWLSEQIASGTPVHLDCAQ